jgi:HJR/Mrr/RecB family endonuclease
MCGRPGSSENLDINHITPLSEGGETDLENLIVLCRSCHAQVYHGRYPAAKLREYAKRTYGFEQTVAEIFSRAGFAVLTGATGPDAGVDVIAQKAVTTGERPVSFVIQCKWSDKGRLRVEDVSAFAAKLSSYGNRTGILVTNAIPTAKVAKIARELGVHILDVNALAKFVQESIGELNE